MLGAAWCALAPEGRLSDDAPALSRAAEQEQNSSLPYSLPPQQDIGHRDEQGLPPSKKLKMAPQNPGMEADPESASEVEAAAGTGKDESAGNGRHVGPLGLGLDFRLLGDPAGFMSCRTQPSSGRELRTVLKSELLFPGRS